jgi:hypothetical protein
MKEHQMILVSADLREVHARLTRKFNASVAQQEEFGIRTPENAVRGRTEAPEQEGPPEA